LNSQAFISNHFALSHGLDLSHYTTIHSLHGIPRLYSRLCSLINTNVLNLLGGNFLVGLDAFNWAVCKVLELVNFIFSHVGREALHDPRINLLHIRIRSSKYVLANATLESSNLIRCNVIFKGDDVTLSSRHVFRMGEMRDRRIQ